MKAKTIFRRLLSLSLPALVCGALAIAASAREISVETQANVMVEIAFKAKRTYHDPFNQVSLDVIFKNPNGEELRVPAFWDGGDVWKVRYASRVLGHHTFRTESYSAVENGPNAVTWVQDKGLNGLTGVVMVKPYTGKNPLYMHGPLRVAEDHRHLQFWDGTPFFWLGDTWWMGLAKRLHWPEDVQTLATDRKEKGFTVIQIVAGLYPDMYPFDQRGANEAGFPWTTNYSTIRPEYFDAADKRLEYLVDQGLTPCIVGAWGYFLPWMGEDKAKAHWRNLIARYGALPVVWCVAGEANLNWYRDKPFPVDARDQVRGWTEVARYMRETDPFHRLITIHPTGIGRLSSRHAMEDLPLLDIDMLQTPHGQADAVAPTVNTVRQSYADHPVMPVIDGEAAYEMLNDSLPTQWTRQMFWLCMMNGAAGHTYGANGIWQNNRKGDPHGPSPYSSGGIGYGRISWDEAMNLPGSGQVGFGKKLLMEYDWTHLQPHPEWAQFLPKPTLTLDAAQWIWFPEGDPTKDAPAAKRYFRRVFVLPADTTVTNARLRMSADNKFDARINGKKLGGSSDWNIGRQFDNLASDLKPGTNILVVVAENLPAGGPNPAGLIANLEIQFSSGTTNILSDDSWLSATNAPSGWDKADFDDSGWSKALAEAHFGGGPWGKLDSTVNDDVHGPQTAAIPGVMRITYIPTGDTVLERELGAAVLYHVTYFDPVTGQKTKGALAVGDGTGTWFCSPPPGVDHDWVLILEQTSPGEKE